MKRSRGTARPDAARIAAAARAEWRRSAAAIARSLLTALALLAGLTACLPPVALSSVSRDVRTQHLSQMKLLDLGADGAVHLVKHCGDSTPAGVESCGASAPVSLLVRPNGWSMTQLARKAPLSIANIDSAQTSFSLPIAASSATNFVKPLIGQRNTSDRFIGALSAQGRDSASFVWLPPDATLPDESRPTDRLRERRFSEVAFPQSGRLAEAALILQDDDKLWLFVRRDEGCEASLCVTLDEMLDGDIEALPRALWKQKFALYFASDAAPSGYPKEAKRFERVLRQAGRKGDPRRLLGDVPKPRGAFVFDAATIGYSDFSETTPSISCQWSSYAASVLLMLSSEKRVESAAKFNGCKVMADAIALELRPAKPAQAPARYTSDDPLQSRVTSTYFCSPSPGAGQAMSGSGRHGCGFVLRNPVTHAPLPLTPYALALNVTTDGVDQGDRFDTLAGVTDREGRTAFVRSDRPIETALIGLVPRYRTAAELSGPLAEFSGRSVTASRTFDSLKEGVIIWSPGKYRAAGTPYRIKLCSGQVHEARTDENAMTVAYDPVAKRACAITLELLSGR